MRWHVLQRAKPRLAARVVRLPPRREPLVMADLMHRRRFKKHLQELDPKTMVAYSNVSKGALAKALEKDGFVVE